jgi:hypothetical protein
MDRGDGDAVAGVDPHGIDILDGETMMALSCLSRITSISNSFHPISDSSRGFH